MLYIITTVVNNPKFIELQHKTLKKYIKGEYEFIVFNDAKKFPDFTNYGNPQISMLIQNTCSNLGIKCIPVPNSNHMFNKDAAKRCADTHNFVLDYMIKIPGKYLSIDSDMFLISEFNTLKFDNYDVAIVPQIRGHIKYFWNGIYYFNTLIMNNQKMLKWDCGLIEGEQTDVGGSMYHWLNNTTQDCIYTIKHFPSLTWEEKDLPNHINSNILSFCKNDTRNENNKFFSELYDNTWFHYRAGGNWRGEGANIQLKLTNELEHTINNMVN